MTATKRSAKSNPFPSFRSMQDAGIFLQKLNMSPASEVKYALWLQIYTPLKFSEILTARWCNVDFQLKAFWVDKLVRNGHIRVNTLLPDVAVQFLNELHSYSGNGDLLFPELSTMKKADRDEKISHEVQSLWVKYLVDVNGFRYFFAEMAKANSCFSQSFIEEVMTGKTKIIREIEQSNFQRRALVEWWSLELKVYLSWTPYYS